jgi:hypothetical protein
MALSSSKPQIDPQELALQSLVQRASEGAKSQIVRILGGKPFAKVRVGLADTDLGKSPSVRRGFTVNALFSSSNAKATVEVEKQVATWLKQCHGARFEDARDDSLFKTGNKTVYIAIQ